MLVMFIYCKLTSFFCFIAYATHLGLSSSQGAIILSAGSGMNAFGRIVSG